jgi:hypothetical protein
MKATRWYLVSALLATLVAAGSTHRVLEGTWPAIMSVAFWIGAVFVWVGYIQARRRRAG